MQTPPRIGILIGLALGSAALCAEPAVAFSLFGIHLWGANTSDDSSTSSTRCPTPSASTSRAARRASRADSRTLPRSGRTARPRPLETVGSSRRPAATTGGCWRRSTPQATTGRRSASAPAGRKSPTSDRRRVSAERSRRGRRRPRAAVPLRRDAIVNAPHPPDDPPRDTPASVGFETGKPARLRRDQPGFGDLDRALAAALLRQGRRGRPRRDRRPSRPAGSTSR